MPIYTHRAIIQMHDVDIKGKPIEANRIYTCNVYLTMSLFLVCTCNLFLYEKNLSEDLHISLINTIQSLYIYTKITNWYSTQRRVIYKCAEKSPISEGGGVQFESTLIWLEKKGLLEITIFDNHL